MGGQQRRHRQPAPFVPRQHLDRARGFGQQRLGLVDLQDDLAPLGLVQAAQQRIVQRRFRLRQRHGRPRRDPVDAEAARAHGGGARQQRDVQVLQRLVAVVSQRDASQDRQTVLRQGEVDPVHRFEVKADCRGSAFGAEVFQFVQSKGSSLPFVPLRRESVYRTMGCGVFFTFRITGSFLDVVLPDCIPP